MRCEGAIRYRTALSRQTAWGFLVGLQSVQSSTATAVLITGHGNEFPNFSATNGGQALGKISRFPT